MKLPLGDAEGSDNQALYFPGNAAAVASPWHSASPPAIPPKFPVNTAFVMKTRRGGTGQPRELRLLMSVNPFASAVQIEL